MYKILHRKLKIELHEPPQKWGRGELRCPGKYCVQTKTNYTDTIMYNICGLPYDFVFKYTFNIDCIGMLSEF